MIVDSHLVANMTQRTPIYDLKDQVEQGKWTIRKSASSVFVPRQDEADFSNLYENFAYPWVVKIWNDSISLIEIKHDGLMRTRGSFFSGANAILCQIPVSGRHAVTLENILFIPYRESDAVTTAEQFSEPDIALYESVPTATRSTADLRRQLQEVFALAAGEHFEDGMDTEFSHELQRFIKAQGLEAIATLRRAMERYLFRETYLAEALLWIGELDDNETSEARRNLLEGACGSDSVSIRDAAISGISYLGATKSKERLEGMLQVEPVDGVRANIEAVLAYIRD